MAQVKLAKDALLQAITTFKCCKSGISNALKAPNVNERILTNKLSKLEEALTGLNSAHTAWVTKADFTDELLEAEVHSNAWLESIWLEYDTIQDAALVIVDMNNSDVTPPTLNNKQKLQMHVKQMASLQADIKHKVDNLEIKVKDDISAAFLELYVKIVEDVKASLEAQFDELSQSILHLDASVFEAKLHTEKRIQSGRD